MLNACLQNSLTFILSVCMASNSGVAPLKVTAPASAPRSNNRETALKIAILYYIHVIKMMCLWHKLCVWLGGGGGGSEELYVHVT